MAFQFLAYKDHHYLQGESLWMSQPYRPLSDSGKFFRFFVAWAEDKSVAHFQKMHIIKKSVNYPIQDYHEMLTFSFTFPATNKYIDV